MIETTSVSPADFDAEAKKLRRHFSFTASDLNANQSSVLSEKQQKRLAREEKGGKTVGFVIGGGLLIIAAAAALPLVGVIGGLKLIKDMPWVSALWGGFGLVFGLIALAIAAGGVFLIVSQFMNKKEDRLQACGAVPTS